MKRALPVDDAAIASSPPRLGCRQCAHLSPSSSTSSPADDGDTAAGDTDTADCEVLPEDPDYVQIGFWMNSECSGEPIKVNSFPVEPDAPCYCWPGHSGENSAIDFSCDPGAQSFTYTQYTTPTCGGGSGGVVKTVDLPAVRPAPPRLSETTSSP